MSTATKPSPLKKDKSYAIKTPYGDENEESIGFYFCDAEQLKQLRVETLPCHQEIRERHPGMLVRKEVRFSDVLFGDLVDEYCTISHRWLNKDEPDKEGVQLKVVQHHLDDNPNIKYVWFDYWCMPQDQRTLEQRGDDTIPDTRPQNVLDEFKEMLDGVNRLYLGTSVLIIIDLTYVGRFWTQLEAVRR